MVEDRVARVRNEWHARDHSPTRRLLFGASRKQKTIGHDADGRRKYLTRFGSLKRVRDE